MSRWYALFRQSLDLLKPSRWICVFFGIFLAFAWNEGGSADLSCFFLSIARAEEALEIVEVEELVRPDYVLLHAGSSGKAVEFLQERLLRLGYDAGGIDGKYGGSTVAAVKEFQLRNGLDVDGIAGEKTQEVLYSADAAPAQLPENPTDVLAGDWPYLVNRDHPISEDFIPANLVFLEDELDEALVKIKYRGTRGVREAVEALKLMLEAAKAEGITNWQISAGYRTWASQESLLNNKIQSLRNRHSGWSKTQAREAALKTVAEPGTSEHHLGLAFDVNVPGAKTFSSTKQCKWLHKHCWEYGFIIRYQKEKESITGFAAEAWHIRYVGVDHALAMQRDNVCLEEYVLNDPSGNAD